MEVSGRNPRNPNEYRHFPLNSQNRIDLAFAGYFRIFSSVCDELPIFFLQWHSKWHSTRRTQRISSRDSCTSATVHIFVAAFPISKPCGVCQDRYFLGDMRKTVGSTRWRSPRRRIGASAYSHSSRNARIGSIRVAAPAGISTSRIGSQDQECRNRNKRDWVRGGDARANAIVRWPGAPALERV